jgi:hypothetical protein
VNSVLLWFVSLIEFRKRLLTHMKFSAKRLGLLLNFNVPLLKGGIKRLIVYIIFSVVFPL